MGGGRSLFQEYCLLYALFIISIPVAFMVDFFGVTVRSNRAFYVTARAVTP